MPNKCCIGTDHVLTFCDPFASLISLANNIMSVSHRTEQNLEIVVGASLFVNWADDGKPEEWKPFYFNYCPICGVRIIEASIPFMSKDLQKTLDISGQDDPKYRAPIERGGVGLTRGEVFGKGGIIKKNPLPSFVTPHRPE